jgi:2-polyprenyl-3-methyl-5-hydroxy-6-metoxy-1,4-benzoquinol methylase
MSLKQVEFVPRTRCALYAESGEDCSPFWSRKTVTSDFESGLGDFDIKYCSRCQVGFTDPYPTEATSGFLYEEKTSGDFDRIQDSWIDGIKNHLAGGLLKKIAPASDPARVRRFLDYSCGNARFASLAAQLFSGAEIDAVDYQEKPPAIFSTPQRMRYIQAADFAKMTQRYDLIFLRHVLEHTHRPVELIRLLASRLQPTGVLYIEVPNLRSGCARVFGGKWKGYYAPRHIFHFTRESLAEIIELAGLQGRVEKTEMPLMGNMVAILFGLKKENRLVQFLGILLHPVQLGIEFFSGSSSCLGVRATPSPASESIA